MQESSLPGLAEILAPNNLSPLAQQAESIFVAERNERDVKVLLADKNLKIKVQPVTTLESLVRVLWPDASQGM